MQRLKIHLYQAGEAEPETVVGVPLASLGIGLGLLPKRIQASLAREGIELADMAQLVGEKGPPGTLIEVEKATEKLVISVE